MEVDLIAYNGQNNTENGMKRKLCENNNDIINNKKLRIAKEPIAVKAESTNVHQTQRKRLELNSNKKDSKKQKFIYGNYSMYYGYRNMNKDHHDIRLDIFEKYKDLLRNKDVLDIGCNTGFITLEVAKRFNVKRISGIDIDRSLINQANNNVLKLKKSHPNHTATNFPYNIQFIHGNYVLKDDVLLEIENEQFDVILCLSITKWIQLNFGDNGLKQAFKRMFLQLHSGGKLILEAQSYDNYYRRKKMTESIFENYKAIKFFPKDFTEYLLSSEIGFKSTELMGVPEHCAAGFKRPIQIFNKE